MNIECLKSVFIKRGMPLQLIFFVTGNCNCRCRHCNIMNAPKLAGSPLTLGEIDKIASGLKGLVSLSLTGGEPFLRPQLDEIADIFCKKSRIRNLAIITNGTLTDKVLSFTEKILTSYPRLNFFIGISLDALNYRHDQLRVLPGCFDKAVETIRGLKKIKQHHKSLSVGTATTCSGANQDGLVDTYRFIADTLRPDAIGINLQRSGDWQKGVPGLSMEQFRRFTDSRNADIKSGLLAGHPDRFLNLLFIAKEKIQYDLIEKIYSQRKYSTACFSGSLMGVLKEDGLVFACEMLADEMGNIRDFNYDFRKLWFSRTADRLRNKIRRQRCFCTYECAMTANILFNPKYYPRLIKEMFFYR